MSRLQLINAGIQIDGCWLVRDISLDIEPGQVTILVGPNGSGKSTVLRLLAGLWKPSAGVIHLDERPIRDYSRQELARRVTFVPQDTRIEFGFTVRDVVSMGRHPHLGRFESERAEDRRAVETALERADVLHLAERPVNELSGGERQRVLIARSLATQADVILLDEPTSNLDVDHSLEILGIIHQLCRDGKAVALALHDLNAVARWADRVAVLHRGVLHAFGTTAEVLQEKVVEPVFSVQLERLHSAEGKTALLFHRRPDPNSSHLPVSAEERKEHFLKSPIHEVPLPNGETKKVRVQDGHLFVCQGCCCGRTDRGFPAIPLDEFKTQWKDRGIRRRFHLTISGCLGPCSMANVVLIQFRGHSVWLHSVNSADDVSRIYNYVENMLQVDRWLPPPADLEQQHFQRYLADSIEQRKYAIDCQ